MYIVALGEYILARRITPPGRPQAPPWTTSLPASRRAPCGYHEAPRGDMLPEPGNAPRPEPIDVISKGLRDGEAAKAAMVRSPQQIIVAIAERSSTSMAAKTRRCCLSAMLEKSFSYISCI